MSFLSLKHLYDITFCERCQPDGEIAFKGEVVQLSESKSERHVVEVEKGSPEEERQSSQEKGKATKERAPPWGRRAKKQQRHRNL